ncbi:MAG: tail fiber domain-containing protein [Candidatus Gastranaerophilaceae bacterium]
MGNSNKAPSQPTTTTDMGLFGSTKTGRKGSTFTPTDFQTQFVTNAENAMINAQNAYNNREVAQEAVDNMNRQYQLDFQNQLLSPALSKGWLRGSTAQDVATVANQDYQNRRYELVNEELQRQQQALANNLANYTTMYDIAKGTTGLSNALNQAVSNYALQAAAMNNANSINWGNLLGTARSAYLMSDIRVKENLEKLDTIDGINIYKFDYINGAKNQIGVIAQEMQEKCPECVVEGDILRVDYSKLPEKVQERIEELRK